MAERVSKFVRAWFANSDEDLRGAVALHQMDAAKYLHIVPYLCQQAVEKSLKGFLSYKKIKFEKTHDIANLAQLVIPLTPSLEGSFKEASRLTTFAIQFRYPDAASAEPTLEDSTFSIRIARKVCEEILSLIPSDNPMGF